MSNPDAVRQAAEECAKEVFRLPLLRGPLSTEKKMADIIERAMRKLCEQPKEETCGIAQAATTSMNEGTHHTAKDVSPSDGLFLPDVEWAFLSVDSRNKVSKWFQLATERLQAILDEPAPIAGEEELVEKLAEQLSDVYHNGDSDWNDISDNRRRVWKVSVEERFMPIIRAYVAKRTHAATLAEHKSHIEYENELYATLVDPLAKGAIKEAEMRKQLLESARWYRQHVYDLETQLNGIAECVKEAERKARLDEAKIWRQLKADLRPDSLFIEWAGERIADLEAKERK